MTIESVFTVYLVLFFVILVGLSMIGKKWISDASDMIIAAREISLPMSIIGVMAIGFAGTTVTLCPGFTILYGLEGSVYWDVLYCILGLVAFGLTVGPIARRSGAQTIVEFMEVRYSKSVRTLVSITMLMAMCGLLSNNLTSCVVTIYGFTGWNQTLILAGLFIVVLLFVSMAGLWSTTFTDMFQVILGCIVVPTIFVLLVNKFGGFDAVNAAWPGGNSFRAGLGGATLPMMEWTYPSFINFVICFGCALVYGSNLYWLRSASSRNEKVVTKSFVIGGILTLLVFYLPFSILGQYAGAMIGEEFVQLGGTHAQTEAYGLLARTFPVLFGSLCVVGAVAASVSTSSSNVMGATSVATRDIYLRFRPNTTPKQRVRSSKIIMGLIVAFTWVLCQFPGGNTYLFAFANCWMVPVAILVFVGSFWNGLNATGAKWGCACGMIVMVIVTVLGTVLQVFYIDNYIYTASLGFFVTLVVTVIVSLCSKPSYYAAKGWERVPNDHNRENITLDETDKKVIDLIRKGYVTLAEITDSLGNGADSSVSTPIIEKLDKGGYIIRDSLTGKGFYKYELSAKGLEVANANLNEQEIALADKKLNVVAVDVLRALASEPEKVNETFKAHNVDGMQIAAISYRLNEEGYIAEKGIFRRKLEITEKGRSVAAEYAQAR